MLEGGDATDLALLVGHAAGGDVSLEADDRLDPRLLGCGVERDDPYMDPLSVSVSAGIPCSATRLVISPMRLSPSSRLNPEDVEMDKSPRAARAVSAATDVDPRARKGGGGSR
jgi:hypothetical protein